MNYRHSVSGSTRFAYCMAIVAILGSGRSTAQDQTNKAPETAAGGSVGLEEVTVTARMKSESLISVPVAVTAVGAEELNRHSANDLSKIAELAPQVIVTQTVQGGGGAFNIRGIGSSPGDPGLEQSVSINLDGIQLSRGRLVNLSMFDLAQVEVLKGPQALFFGKNSSAGVISLTSAGPSDTFQSSAKAGYEFVSDQRFVEGAIGGPLTDQLKFRLAARASESAGYLRNVAVAQPSPFQGPLLPEPGAGDYRQPANRDGNVRLTLGYQPIEGLDATLKLLSGRDRGNSGSGASEVLCPAGMVPVTYGVPDPTGDCSLNRVRSSGALNPTIAAQMPGARDGKPYTSSDLFIGSAKINYRFNNLVLTSVSGYTWLNFGDLDNNNFTTFCEICSHEQEKDRNWSEELRLSSEFDFPLNFTVGAFYQKSNVDIFADYTVFYTGPDPRNGKYHAVEHPTQNTGDTISPFGQLRWNIVSNVELAGGVRWTQEKKETHTGNTFVNSLIPSSALDFRPEFDFLDTSLKQSNVSPEATLTWHPTPRQTLYAAYKTGYKSGGFSVPGVFNTSYNASNISFNPEKVKGFEIGYKAELFDHRLRFEGDAYHYTFSNLQLSSFDDKSFSFYVRNAGRAKTEGVEGSLEFQASRGLSVHTSIAYNRARYISFDTAQCYQLQPVATVAGVPGTCFNNAQNLSGKQLTRAPDVVGNIGASYDTALYGQYRMGFNADARYSSGFYPEETLSPFAHEDAFWLVNAGVHVYPDGEQWELALIGTNLTDKIYYYQAYDMPGAGGNGSYAASIEPPRGVLLQATVRF